MLISSNEQKFMILLKRDKNWVISSTHNCGLHNTHLTNVFRFLKGKEQKQNTTFNNEAF